MELHLLKPYRHKSTNAAVTRFLSTIARVESLQRSITSSRYLVHRHSDSRPPHSTRRKQERDISPILQHRGHRELKHYQTAHSYIWGLFWSRGGNHRCEQDLKDFRRAARGACVGRLNVQARGEVQIEHIWCEREHNQTVWSLACVSKGLDARVRQSQAQALRCWIG